jgi:archaellum biogenesis ATPase FlaH
MNELKYKQISVKEAIDMGYTHAGYEDFLIKLKDIDLDCINHFNENGNLLVVDCKNVKVFDIGEGVIKEKLMEVLEDQDVAWDENDHLYDALEKVDFTEITAKVNEAFSKVKFHDMTDYKIVSL